MQGLLVRDFQQLLTYLVPLPIPAVRSVPAPFDYGLRTLLSSWSYSSSRTSYDEGIVYALQPTVRCMCRIRNLTASSVSTLDRYWLTVLY